jgi:hypothetical protein
VNKSKRPIDAWGIGFAFINNARREPMTRIRAVLSAIAASAVILVIAEGVIAWPL